MADEEQAMPQLDTPFVDERGVIALPWYRLLISLWNRTGGATGGSTTPSGLCALWPSGQAAPSGWLLCNGTAVSRTSFKTLFGLIGTTWGAGDGTTSFNLPDFRDRFVIGAGATYALAAQGGSVTSLITQSNLPAYSLNVTDPGHAHSQQVVSNNTAGTAGSQGGSAANNTSVGTTGSATTGITVDSGGGDVPLAILPPYLACNYIIKT